MLRAADAGSCQRRLNSQFRLLDAAMSASAGARPRAKIEDLTARVIRLETALEIALPTRGAGGSKRLPRQSKES
jgi:hypothetical protein